MYAALDKCGMTVEEIFEELDRRRPGTFKGVNTEENVKQGAFFIELILFERFGRRLREVTAHKVTL